MLQSWIVRPRNILLAFLGVFLVLGTIIVTDMLELPGETEDVVYHGPHFSNDQVAAASRANFSWAVRQKQIVKKSQSSSTVSAPIIITDVPVAPIASSTPSVFIDTASTTRASGGQYGIAAGGALIWYTQAQLEEYFTELKALGVGWVRWDVDWSAIQPNNATTYAWAGADRVAVTAAKYGIKSLAIITIAPAWALDPKVSCTIDAHCPPLDPSAFARFATAAATRYKGIINTWEIWNEPNLNGVWRTAAGGAGYPAYLKAAYIAIKQVDSSATVLSGGLSAAADTKDNTSPATFVRALYAAGDKEYFDGIALHPYSYPVTAGYVATWNSWQQMSGVRQLMIDNGDSAKKIWITEYGAPTGGPGSVKSANQLAFTFGEDYMSEFAQQQMMEQVLALYTDNKSWVGPFFWYSLKDNGTSTVTPENFFGILRYDGGQKPAYLVYKQVIATRI